MYNESISTYTKLTDTKTTQPIKQPQTTPNHIIHWCGGELGRDSDIGRGSTVSVCCKINIFQMYIMSIDMYTS